jgi:DNA-directed RNA polymerase subunit H (RpoH/RPB5)
MAKADLPQMLHTDPVCAWFGWKRGAVVEVQQQRHCGLVRSFRIVT